MSLRLTLNYQHYNKENGLGENVHSGCPKAYRGPTAYGTESLERCFSSLNASLSFEASLDFLN